MTTKRPVQVPQQHLRRQTEKASPVAFLPEQSPGAIGQRRAIRESFHDSKAHTIKAKRR